MKKENAIRTLADCRAFMSMILDCRQRSIHYTRCTMNDIIDVFNLKELILQVEKIMNNLDVIFKKGE